MQKNINPLKGGTDLKSTVKEDRLQDMQNAVKNFFNILMVDYNKFDAGKAFKSLYEYVITYKRITYSTISNIIYDCNNDGSGQDLFGTILSNLESLVAYAEDVDNISKWKTAVNTEEQKSAVDDTQKAVWKIWDHVNLAHQQYIVLRQSDDEYDKRFETRIEKFKSGLVNEVNSQLLTMVGIFTALAFLIFGSIGSLESIFSDIKDTPILKLMIIGCVWGLVLLNLVFVFLFCIGKMTKLHFKSTERKDASFFQRYPVVCWTDFIIIALLVVFLWMYYIVGNDADSWIVLLIGINPTLVFFVGFAIIAVIVFLCTKWLIKKTRQLDGDEDTY